MKHKFPSHTATYLAISLMFSAGASQAGLVSIDNLTASWINDAPTNVATITGNGSGSASMFWGIPATAAGQSGYNFTTAPTPISYEVPPSTPDFLIGTWTHYNNPIYEPSLDSVQLMLSAEISVDSISQGTLNFYFDFLHDETTNNDNPCANGGDLGVGVNSNGCADIVDISYNTLSESFLVDGTLYTLNIAAGSNHFETLEAFNNTFDMYANIVATNSVVPEPSTMLLLGGGISFLGFVRRRTSRHSRAVG